MEKRPKAAPDGTRGGPAQPVPTDRRPDRTDRITENEDRAMHRYERSMWLERVRDLQSAYRLGAHQATSTTVAGAIEYGERLLATASTPPAPPAAHDAVAASRHD